MLLGTDPEFFIFDTKKNFFVSASEVFGGKDNPFSFDSNAMTKDGKRYKFHSSSRLTKVFRDGFAVELNILPSHCRETLTLSLQAALHDVEVVLEEKNPSWRLRSAATIPVPLEYIETLPKDVKTFGCDPAMNAYREGEERIELNGEVHPFRYGGGHMHFSTFEVVRANPERAFQIVKLFDLLIGLPFSLIFNSEDEFLRRKYYGKAGEFRFQEWGLEYRVPSPRIWNHPLIASLFFGVGRSLLLSPTKWGEVWDNLKKDHPSLEEKLIRAINKGEGGEELLQRVNYLYKKETISFLGKEGKDLFKLNELTLHKLNIAGGKGFEWYMNDNAKSNLIAGSL